jgi:ankyrin repeat protein
LIEYFVSKNADVNAKDKYGFTALHYAALTNNLKAVEFLLQNDHIKVNIACEKAHSKSTKLKNWLKKHICILNGFFN